MTLDIPSFEDWVEETSCNGKPSGLLCVQVADDDAAGVRRLYDERVAYAHSLSWPLDIYRMIRVASETDIRFYDIGCSWSAEETKAMVVYEWDREKPGGDWLLHGRVTPGNVDWAQTLLFGTSPYGELEDEITLLIPVEIEIIGVKLRGDEGWRTPRSRTARTRYGPRVADCLSHTGVN